LAEGRKTPENKTKTKKKLQTVFFLNDSIRRTEALEKCFLLFLFVRKQTSIKKSCVTTKAIFRGTGYLPIKKQDKKERKKFIIKVNYQVKRKTCSFV
jgi:hypothetical protein